MSKADNGTHAGRPARPASDLRNLVLAGQSGAGKTLLSERLLFACGAIKAMGRIEDGTTASDWSDDEKAIGHSLRPTMLHVEHEQHLINLIDAPGLADFVGHTISCFPAVETVCLVVDAVRGIEPMTRRLMAVAAERNLPRMIIVNKIDEAGADLAALVEQIREAFGPVCLPINLPLADRSGVADVFEHDDGPPTVFSSESAAHARILEQVIEMRDELMARYLEDGSEANIEPDRIHEAFEAALREAHLIPIAFASAATGAGIPELLHIFAGLLPSPDEGNPRPFIQTAGGEEREYVPRPDPELPVLAHVFKISTDPFAGKLAVFRVHQGTVRAKTELLLDTEKKPVRIAHLYKRQGREQVEVAEIGPGDIGAFARIEELSFDAVLHESHELDGVHLRPLPLPRAMFARAVHIDDHKDEAKFSTAIHRLMDEDPCLHLDRIAATRQTVLRGLGEMHLNAVIERIRRDFRLEVRAEIPKVAYTETITSSAEGHHRHKKQTGGAGQFGEVFLRVEPLAPDGGEGFEFVNATVGGSIPRQFMPAIEKGVREVMRDGAVAGYPMTGIRVEVYDGKFHAVDSKEVAFATAGRRAFIDAVSKASPVLLEPFVRLEITAPASAIGDINADIAQRRGRVQDTQILPGDRVVVVAVAPSSELQSYATELRSLTAGAGTFVMDFSHDEPCPAHVQAEIIAAFRHEHDAEAHA